MTATAENQLLRRKFESSKIFDGLKRFKKLFRSVFFPGDALVSRVFADPETIQQDYYKDSYPDNSEMQQMRYQNLVATLRNLQKLANQLPLF